ncbi:substrate-binding periplasmic protein [Inhella proteolytica]|uniref:Transporter substrate-binding domain-containing protein n=1 Tax=Inhella proteolytica TaxID=2795029 RepID=A0A931J6M7_9BURK|nr:transporter substrate-binding domain-containing protein [Inhella proteolytica]MBH9579728.1 transporter substrate-binding domain-containing protein [Inhella proteolytica]
MLWAWGGALVLAASAQADCKLRIRWTEDPPFSLQRPDGSLGGLQVDLARAAFGRMGCQLVWIRLPWARALRDLEQGQLDVLMGTLRRPEREAFAWFSAPNRSSRNLLYVRQDALARWDRESLLTLRTTGFRLGAQVDVSYGAEFDQLAQDPEFRRHMVISPHRSALWRMLDLGRIDGLIADEWTATRELRQLALQERVAHTRAVISTQQVGDAFSKRTLSLELVRRYDQAVAQMQADGSLQALLDSYLSPQDRHPR